MNAVFNVTPTVDNDVSGKVVVKAEASSIVDNNGVSFGWAARSAPALSLFALPEEAIEAAILLMLLFLCFVILHT